MGNHTVVAVVAFVQSIESTGELLGGMRAALEALNPELPLRQLADLLAEKGLRGALGMA